MTIHLDPAIGGIVTQPTGLSPSAPSYVEPLRFLGSARQLAASTTSTSVALTSGTYGVRLFARDTDMRFALGSSSVVAHSTTGHWLARGTEVYLRVNAGETHLAVIRSSTAVADGTLEISELQNT